jgi:N6-L-threonylcarbamoyladenine synthase
MKRKIILAFETSCDDTSVALISDTYDIISQLTQSQLEHIKFGGVLPELASRLHIKNILYLTDSILAQAQIHYQDISAIAVSINPGLIGSLIVGLSFAKSLAWCNNIPLITINHMIGHLFANHLVHNDVSPPFLALVVSGGHTELVHFISDNEFICVGKTFDDAAGETFDKVAQILNLGYPGGPILDKLSLTGNPDFYKFPRALKQTDDFNFSYSGLKTSIKTYISMQNKFMIEKHLSDLAASIQEAIIDPLVSKTFNYAVQNNINKILLCGGVAANSRLRFKIQEQADLLNCEVFYPPINLCMDNAAMIGAAAINKLLNNDFSDLAVNASSLKGLRIV